MSQELQIAETEKLTTEDKIELATNIDRLIEVNKNNRQAINRLVFESVAAMTEADDAATILSRKDTLRRWIGGITGTNQKLQNTVNKNRSAAQYAAWQTIQKLAEQNLMTFDLISAVNNKLNASLTKIDDEFASIYEGLGKFLRYNREELTKLENRLAKVEQNVELLNWKNSIRHQVFNGNEYKNLDFTTKVICLVRDFYDITKGNWTISDFLLLKSTLDEIGIIPAEKNNYFDTLKAIYFKKELKEKYLGEVKLSDVNEAGCPITMSALKKLESFNTDEKYIVDAIANSLPDNSKKANKNAIASNLTKEYLKSKAQVDVDMDVESYDLVLDLLFNIKTVNEAVKEEPLITGAGTENKGAMTPNENDGDQNHEEEMPCDVQEGNEETVENNTDETINSILQISNNEKKLFKNKNLHFNTYVNCEGTLEFEHCTLYYNEDGTGGKISLAEGATLIIRNSEIICKGLDKKHFITNDDIATHDKACVVVIENTKFYDCSYFITGKIGSLTLDNCELKNCYVGFIEISNYYGDNGVYEITNNKISEYILSTFNYNCDVKYGSVINISVNEKTDVKFLNNRIIEKFSFNKDESIRLEYINGRDSLNITNCYFEGITNPLDARAIKNCKFKDCKVCIEGDSFTNKLLVENCLFENSTKIIKTKYNGGTIRYCQFVSCYNKLIETTSFGGLTIEFCEFYNTKLLRDFYEDACIEFWRGSESKTNSNKLKKCTFNGVEIRCPKGYTNYLIRPVGYEKPHGTVAYVEDCIFKNCYTDNSSKVIIKEWLQYTSFFRDKDYHAISVRNCQGLDRVNKEGKVADHFEIKDVLDKGI